MQPSIARSCLLLVVAASGCGPRAVQPSPDVFVPYAWDRMTYVGSGSGGLPVQGSRALQDDECVEISPMACLPPVRAGRFCEGAGGPWDVILEDGVPRAFACYLPDDDGDVFPLWGDGGSADVPPLLAHTTVTFTDGARVRGDLVVEGDGLSLFGDGTTVVEGDVILRGSSPRVRGLDVLGDILVEGDASAILFNRIHGRLVFAPGGRADASIVAGNVVLGEMRLPLTDSFIVANRVQGPFLVDGKDDACVDNLAFIDLDESGAMDDGEVLGRLSCIPGGRLRQE